MANINFVIEPEFGVQRLPTAELEHVLRTLEAEDRTLAPKLHLNRDAWDRQLERLRDELAERRSGVVRPPLVRAERLGLAKSIISRRVASILTPSSSYLSSSSSSSSILIFAGPLSDLLGGPRRAGGGKKAKMSRKSTV